MKIDLITGFLGAGKTTFIKMYARYLMDRGENICILENDYGAVNVDMLFLQDLLGDRCELEMVIGGDGYEAHRRRFKTKLISMAMMGYDRVLVEPSGIFDVDEFFDVLHEEPLDRWYESGNVISILNACMERDEDSTLSDSSDLLLASQIANAGCVVLSRVQLASPDAVRMTIERMNSAMERYHCGRLFSKDIDVIAMDWEHPDAQILERISCCGYRPEEHVKYHAEQENGYSSLFYFYVSMEESEAREAVGKIFADASCGIVHRIKGFVKLEEGRWLEINALGDDRKFRLTDAGQEAVIVIGQYLNKSVIDSYLGGSAKYHGEL